MRYHDFGEVALAPCTWDLAQFVTSILVAAHSLNLEEAEARALCQNFLIAYNLIAYNKVLAKGHVGIVNRETATGLVKERLKSLKQRKPKDSFNKRTKKGAWVATSRLYLRPSALIPHPSSFQRRHPSSPNVGCWRYAASVTQTLILC